jgi:FAD-linked sulfhydryl oxidase
MTGHGISPLLWGEHQWKLLHMIASTYPENPTEIDNKNYFNFMVALGNVLPCEFCRYHYKNMLSSMNLNMSVFNSQETFFRFVFDMHNQVNTRLKKPVADDYLYIRRKYELYKQL